MRDSETKRIRETEGERENKKVQEFTRGKREIEKGNFIRICKTHIKDENQVLNKLKNN